MLINPVSCLLLEDDEMSAKMIVDIIHGSFHDLKLTVSTDIEEARWKFRQQNPQILILDINLPDGLSFDWLAELYQQGFDGHIVFTTAYADYAIQAFKFSALDFILKPFMPEELIAALHKGLKALDDRKTRMQLETFFYNYKQERILDKKIILKTLEEIQVVFVKDILAIEADNTYSKFHLKEGASVFVSQPLKEFDKQLSAVGFLRVHQSYLVNMSAVKSFKKKSNLLVLEDKLDIPVALSKRGLVIDYLNNLSWK